MTRSTLDTGMCASLPDETALIDCPECGMSAQACEESKQSPRNAIACCPDCRHVRRPINVVQRLSESA